MSPQVAVSTSLNAARRATDLAAVAGGEVVDVLVVGLGATGAGVALDAAARGLSVAAVDAHDLAFGTSRWSSKLVHGGLRYLAKLDVGIAYECAVERHVLMTRTAPHLVRALPMVMPLGDRGRVAMTAGLAAGDLLRMAAGTPRRVLPRPRRLSVTETRAWAPALRPDGLCGGLLNWEGQLCDDARLVVGLARAAAGLGARIITRCRVLSLAGDGAVATDELSGERLEIRARAVVNATGVWAGTLAPEVELRPSRGTHLVLPGAAFGGLCAGLTIPVPGETNRFVIALPQADGRVYAGLTDEPVAGPLPDVPDAPESDVTFLLDVLNAALGTPLRRGDVLGAYAGLRPLLADGAGRTADVSRRHAVLTGPDVAVRARGLPAGPSRTRRLPLPGAATPGRLAAVAAPRRLVARYGTEAPAVLAAGDPTPVAPGCPITAAELAWAVRHEGALDVADLLDRRTRLGLVPTDRAAAVPAAEAALSTG